LVRAWGVERVEAACHRASILRNNLDRAYRPQPVPDEPPIQHGNIRGGRYCH